MALQLDHYCVGVQNIYEGAMRMFEETGFAAYDGGYFHQWGGAQKTIPLGRNNYMEINSVVDAERAKESRFGRWFYKVGSHGDHLVGLTLRADSREEIEAFARRNDVEARRDWGRVRPDGKRNRLISISGEDHIWPRGLPSVSFFPDMDDHPANAYSAPHRVEPDGMAWVEMGDEPGVRAWLGDEYDPDEIGLRFVDRSPGLYAVAVRTKDGQEVVIRRPNATWAHFERPPVEERGSRRELLPFRDGDSS